MSGSKESLCISEMAAQGVGLSQVPRRRLALSDPPGMATGKIADKGYINQRTGLQRRAAEVDALHPPFGDPRVIRL